jgi:hypothetical protein
MGREIVNEKVIPGVSPIMFISWLWIQTIWVMWICEKHPKQQPVGRKGRVNCEVNSNIFLFLA